MHHDNDTDPFQSFLLVCELRSDVSCSHVEATRLPQKLDDLYYFGGVCCFVSRVDFGSQHVGLLFPLPCVFVCLDLILSAGSTWF